MNYLHADLGVFIECTYIHRICFARSGICGKLHQFVQI